MSQTHTNGATGVQERLKDPEVVASLNRILDRLDALEQGIEALSGLADTAPALVSMAVDTVDDTYRDAERAGVDLDERLHNALALAEKLTAPQTMRVLSELVDRTDQLEQLLTLADQAPGLVAMFADIADEFFANAQEEGLDFETGFKQGLTAAIQFGNMMGPQQLASIQALMESGVLDPRAISVVGTAGEALVKCQEECLAAEEPPRMGLFGMLRAGRDPDVQRALAFVTNFARFFGQAMSSRHSAFRKKTSSEQ